MKADTLTIDVKINVVGKNGESLKDQVIFLKTKKPLNVQQMEVMTKHVLKVTGCSAVLIIPPSYTFILRSRENAIKYLSAFLKRLKSK